MRVLEIITSTEIGGAPKHLADLMQELSSEKNIILYLASPNDPPFFDKLSSYSKEHFILKKNTFEFKRFIHLLSFIKKNKIDLIHSHGRGAGVYSRLLFLFGLKVIHTFHGIHAEQTFIGRIKTLTDKILSAFADHYIFVSKDEKERALMHSFYPQKKPSSVILNGVDLNQYPYRGREILSKPHLILGTFTRPDYAKAPDLLINNLEILNKQTLPFTWELYLAGRDLHKIQIPSSLLEKVKVLGEIKNTSDFYQQIDLFVSFSRWEGMPLSIIEAMSAGTPCLISEVSGHHYFSQNNVAVSFDANNFDSFFNGITIIRSDREISIRARTFIEQNHSSQQMAHEISKLYICL